MPLNVHATGQPPIRNYSNRTSEAIRIWVASGVRETIKPTTMKGKHCLTERTIDPVGSWRHQIISEAVSSEKKNYTKKFKRRVEMIKIGILTECARSIKNMQTIIDHSNFVAELSTCLEISDRKHKLLFMKNKKRCQTRLLKCGDSQLEIKPSVLRAVVKKDYTVIKKTISRRANTL